MQIFNLSLFLVFILINSSHALRCYTCQKKTVDRFTKEVTMSAKCSADSKMSEETCSDSKEFCSYMKDIYLSAEYRHGCAIPKGKKLFLIFKLNWIPLDPNQGYSSFSRVTDTLDSGGNYICWYRGTMQMGKQSMHGNKWEEYYSGDAACFCNSDLCNSSLVQNPSFFLSFLLLLQAGNYLF